jgi:hypothetical protein
LIRYEGKIEEAESKIERLMAPYDENMEVEPTKDYLDDSSIESMKKHYKLETLEELQYKLKDWTGHLGGIDEKGLYSWSTYNPKSKWDWYQIGGRWQGELILKQGSRGRYFREPNRDRHELSIAEQLKKEVGFDVVSVDIAYLKDVDYETMLQRSKDLAEKDWVEAKKADPVEKYFVHGVEKGETKKQFLLRRTVPLKTHAVLVEGKEWEEPSEVGWFGCTHDEKESEVSWATQFKERYLSNPTENTVIAIVDYHI